MLTPESRLELIGGPGSRLADLGRQRLILTWGDGIGHVFSEPGQQLIDQPSPAEKSKLAYELVEPDLAYAEADMLDADTIPLSYRDLVKRYFQAVGPRGQHDH